MKELKEALTAAFNEPYSLLGSYLDNLGVYHMALLEVVWEHKGSQSDSILGYAEKIRKS